MFQSLLLAVDGSPMSLKAADAALGLAELFQARLTLLSVAETAPQYVATSEENDQEYAAARSYYQRLQDPIRKLAERKGIVVQGKILNGNSGQAILRAVNEQHSDLLIAGSQGRSGAWGAFLGSTVDKLVNHAPCSMLVIRENMGKKLYKRLLVALDGSPLSWQAFHLGLQMAQALGAALEVISVVEGPTAPAEKTGALPSLSEPASPTGRRWDWSMYLSQAQASAIAQAELTGVHLETSIREGHASSVLVSEAREHRCDLLLLGATGHEHPWSETSGGTARKVANEASCAVMLIRPPATQQRVRDLMSKTITTIAPETPLSQVISLLIEQETRLLIVTSEPQRPSPKRTGRAQAGRDDEGEGEKKEQQVIGVITLGSLLAHDDAYHRLDLRQAAHADRLGPYLRRFFQVSKTAREVMITRPLVVRDDIAIEPAVRWMLSHHITRMPVVEASGNLVGLLDQESLLRASTGFSRVTETPLEQPRMPLGVSPQMVGDMPMTPVPSVALDMPLVELLHEVQQTSARRVIVVNHEGKAIGVIADRDLLAAQGMLSRRNPLLALAGRFSLRFPEELFHRHLSTGPLTAQQVMKPHLYSVRPSTPIVEAVRLMLAHQIKRLVVLDDAGKPLGMIDRQQLLRAFLESGLLPG